MSLRACLRHLGLPLALACAAAGARSQPPQPPIADVHFHLAWSMKAEDLKERMEKNNVRWVVGAGAVEGVTGVESHQRDLNARKVIGENYLPAVGWNEWLRAESEAGLALYLDPVNARRDELIRVLDRQLGAGNQAVFAETFPNAENTTTLPWHRRRLPTNAPLYVELFKLAIKHRIPLPMHMEWHPESVRQLEELLSSDRRGMILWSHCGKVTRPADVRPLLEKHPNLLCDLVYRGLPQTQNEHGKFPERTIYQGEGMFRKAGIDPDWRKLIEDFPDRFMVGVDDVHRWSQYDDVVQSIRQGILANLTPETAEKVAWRNAVRVFRLKEPADSPRQ